MWFWLLLLQIQSVYGLVVPFQTTASVVDTSVLLMNMQHHIATPHPQASHHDTTSMQASPRRRSFLGSCVSGGLIPYLAPAQRSTAAYILDDETGDFVQLENVDWQTAWKQRLDKASSMSQEEIFQAARGAGNVNLKDGEESAASKKRRALSGCRSADIRKAAEVSNERECTARVLNGDVQFMLEVL